MTRVIISTSPAIFWHLTGKYIPLYPHGQKGLSPLYCHVCLWTPQFFSWLINYISHYWLIHLVSIGLVLRKMLEEYPILIWKSSMSGLDVPNQSNDIWLDYSYYHYIYIYICICIYIYIYYTATSITIILTIIIIDYWLILIESYPPMTFVAIPVGSAWHLRFLHEINGGRPCQGKGDAVQRLHQENHPGGGHAPIKGGTWEAIYFANQKYGISMKNWDFIIKKVILTVKILGFANQEMEFNHQEWRFHQWNHKDDVCLWWYFISPTMIPISTILFPY